MIFDDSVPLSTRLRKTFTYHDVVSQLVVIHHEKTLTSVIIFFRSKKLAHQMRIVFGLLDLKSDELHGDLSQEQVSQPESMYQVPITDGSFSD